VQFLLAAESTKFISVISFGKELYKRRERPDRFVSNGNYRILFLSLSEALQIAKCFARLYTCNCLYIFTAKSAVFFSARTEYSESTSTKR
jgi:hypothetical protein